MIDLARIKKESFRKASSLFLLLLQMHPISFRSTREHGVTSALIQMWNWNKTNISRGRCRSKKEYNCVYKDAIERDSKQDKQLAISGTPLCQSWEIFMQTYYDAREGNIGCHYEQKLEHSSTCGSWKCFPVVGMKVIFTSFPKNTKIFSSRSWRGSWKGLEIYIYLNRFLGETNRCLQTPTKSFERSICQ